MSKYKIAIEEMPASCCNCDLCYEPNPNYDVAVCIFADNIDLRGEFANGFDYKTQRLAYCPIIPDETSAFRYLLKRTGNIVGAAMENGFGVLHETPIPLEDKAKLEQLAELTITLRLLSDFAKTL